MHNSLKTVDLFATKNLKKPRFFRSHFPALVTVLVYNKKEQI